MYLTGLWYGGSVNNTIEKNFSTISTLVVISKSMQLVKLCSDKIFKIVISDCSWKKTVHSYLAKNFMANI